jgi:hypothetical protein
MYEMDQCSHVYFAEKFVSRSKPFSNKTLRPKKEGSRKIMDFVSIKQYPKNPVHPVQNLFSK